MLKHTSNLLSALKKSGQAVLVTVVKTQGSVPREEGAWMAVLPDALINTLGGGQLEYQAIQEAKRLLQLGEPFTEPFVNRYPLGPSLGQCCGGVVHLSFEWLSSSGLEPLGKRLQGPEPDLALFGGGHVGQAIVQLMEKLPWQVTWIDSRESIFPQSVGHNIELEHSEPVHSAVAHLKPHAHVLIMSFSHAEDLDVLQQCLVRQRERHDLSSIGLIGSATKWATFKSRLSQRGFSEADFLGVQCPIGIEGIHSKEPEIIAVSVVAQLLRTQERTQLLPANY